VIFFAMSAAFLSNASSNSGTFSTALTRSRRGASLKSQPMPRPFPESGVLIDAAGLQTQNATRSPSTTWRLPHQPFVRGRSVNQGPWMLQMSVLQMSVLQMSVANRAGPCYKRRHGQDRP
jgi:hypothetical protein